MACRAMAKARRPRHVPRALGGSGSPFTSELRPAAISELRPAASPRAVLASWLPGFWVLAQLDITGIIGGSGSSTSSGDQSTDQARPLVARGRSY